MIDREELARLHVEKDNFVFKFFNDAMQDVGSVFRTDSEGNSYVSQRAQMIVVFTFVDVCASYWFEYSNRNGTPKSRFLEWFDRYCLHTRNRHYSGTDFAKLSADRYYEFRSSMVHFLGLSANSAKPSVSLIANNMPKSKIQKWREEFRKRGHPVVIFRPKKFYDLVCEGAIEMLQEWKEIIAKSQYDETLKWQHIKGIDRIWQKVQLEGAVLIPIPK